MSRREKEWDHELTWKRIRVIQPLRVVPNGTMVTKRTGTAPLRVEREMKIYDSTPEKLPAQVITARAGTVFLVGARGDANAHPDTMEVIAEWDARDLRDAIEYEYMERESG